MKINFLILLLFISGSCVYAQLPNEYSETEIQTIITNNAAAEGDLYLNTTNNQYYLGLTNGGLQLISDFIPKKVGNELFFEDANYCYVSLKVKTDSYVVTRYTKADVNAESKSTGTGTQPSTLAEVQALTY